MHFTKMLIIYLGKIVFFSLREKLIFKDGLNPKSES